MATRSIITHHPEVECDVCGRRLLRGESPAPFLAAGRSRLVCELCVPRATQEGWRRQSDIQEGESRASRSRRLSLVERLRKLRAPDQGDLARPADSLEPGAGNGWGHRGGGLDPAAANGGGLDPAAGNGRGHPGHLEESDRALEYGGGSLQPGAGSAALEQPAAGGFLAPAGTDEWVLEKALEAFNVSDAAARVAGIARALGRPNVRVAAAADGQDRVEVLVSWELCWYRYEVTVQEDGSSVRLAGDGMELEELSGEERIANAEVNEQGEVSLVWS